VSAPVDPTTSFLELRYRVTAAALTAGKLR
jgi:hypothetical protein